MTEFLTGNARIAYPLERPVPDEDGTRTLWRMLLLDACVATTRADARLYLLSVRRMGLSRLSLTVGTNDGETATATVEKGLPDFAVVYAASATVKALLTVSGRTADRILEDVSYGTGRVDVNVPFAMRCSWDAHRRVESVSAYSARQCERPVFSDGEAPVRTVTGGDVVLAAMDGVDVEVTGIVPLEGSVLRVSAISAPVATSELDTNVDLMIRGDGCFTVEAIPGAKVEGGAVVPRTESEPDGLGVMGGGVIRIGNSCKPCCQCEDYKAAVDMLRVPESVAEEVNDMLDRAKTLYDEAVEAFAEAKEAALEAINSPDNVRCSAVASVSEAAYDGSVSSGNRARVAVTLGIVNMTQANAVIGNISFSVPGFEPLSASWTKVNGGATTSGTSIPSGDTVLSPGGTMAITATYCKTATVNAASKPAGTSVSLSVNGTSRSVAVS